MVYRSFCRSRSLGVQVHGGMGFVEETGAAQYYRDARILPIYEGTNGIQANDLIFRKILRDQGEALKSWIADMKATATTDKIVKAISVLEKSSTVMADKSKNPDDVALIAVPYLNLLGYVAGGVMMERIAKADPSKISVAEFYTAHILPRIYGLAEIIAA